MTTLNDIKTHMLRYMSVKITPSDDSYYDEDGHCGDGLWNDIYTFWENFKSDKDFLYLVSCEWASDDLDLEGGRSYILTHSNIITLVFDYLYNTLGYTKENYNKIIWNSTEFSDTIGDMYDSVPVIRDMKINTILESKNDEDKNKGEAQVIFWAKKPLILKYPPELKEKLDKNPILDFLGYSKLDNKSPIYKVKNSSDILIPGGFEVVPELKEAVYG